jgi:hypothetical protein
MAVEAPAPPRKKEIDWVYATPLFITVIPLVRTLKIAPIVKTRITIGLVGAALVHGTWLISRASEQSAREAEEAHAAPPEVHVSPAQRRAMRAAATAAAAAPAGAAPAGAGAAPAGEAPLK